MAAGGGTGEGVAGPNMATAGGGTGDGVAGPSMATGGGTGEGVAGPRAKADATGNKRAAAVVATERMNNFVMREFLLSNAPVARNNKSYFPYSMVFATRFHKTRSVGDFRPQRAATQQFH